MQILKKKEYTSFETHEWAAEGGLAEYLSVLPGIKTVFLGEGTGVYKHEILRRLGIQRDEETRTYTIIDNFPQEQTTSFCNGTIGYYHREHGS